MSYILDALKRAEAERSRGAVPNIHAQSVPVSATVDDGAASGMPMWLMTAVVLVMLAAAVWWWSADEPQAPGSVAANVPAPLSVSPVPSPALPKPQQPQQPVPVVSAAPSSPLVFKPLPSDPVVTPPSRSVLARPVPAERVYAVKELPNDIRAALPTVSVGGASYSENPASRMLIINGQIHREGDKLTPELTLQQIQLRSAVLSFRGYRYTISY